MEKSIIALVDWNTTGHHGTYMRLFARTLLNAGHRVIVLWPKTEDFEDIAKIATDGCAHTNSPLRLAIAALNTKRSILWPRALRRWTEARCVVPSFLRSLQTCEARLGGRCEFIFFNCLYESQGWLIKKLVEAAARPWSCLYLQSKSLPPHSEKNQAVLDLLQHERLRAFAVLDERSIASGLSITGRKVVQFPDFADGSFRANHPMEQELRTFAAGSRLVLVIGHLVRSKGIFTLAKLALDPRARDLKFAFVGQCKLRRAEKRFIKRVMQSTPNVLFKFGYLPDEISYNACVSACDVLFAAYHDFSHSSNTLAKAAIFEKPLIVSSGHLMAERVHAYHMGEIVPQNDPDSTLAAIRKITDDYPAWLAHMAPRWNAYRELHSIETLDKSFSDILISSKALMLGKNFEV